MRAWLNRLWAEMNEMPGPVWVFGAWAVVRSVKWLVAGTPFLWFPDGTEMDCASVWLKIWTVVAMTVNQLLPLVALWMLLCKKSFSVSLMSLYIGLKGAMAFLGIITTTLHAVNPPIEDIDFGWMQNGPGLVVELLVCVAFLLYLERSKVVAQVFEGEQNRRLPWWAYVVGLALLVAGGI